MKSVKLINYKVIEIEMVNSLYTYLENINLPNVILVNSGRISEYFLMMGINNLYQAIYHVHQLPYGRTSDRANYELVLKEQCGACSTKHALIAELAKSLNVPLYLKLGAIIFNETNSPKIADVLNKYQLNGLLEAHVYLDYEGKNLDITFPHAKDYQINYPLLKEIFISPPEIGDFKITWHKEEIRRWIVNQGLKQDVDEIWKIRELCIHALSAKDIY